MFGGAQKCANPDCEYRANGDPSVSVLCCCEKCEGRLNGEEWAMGGKKKHTAYCTSKSDDGGMMGGGGGGGMMNPMAMMMGGMGGGGGSGRKCANPDCYYMAHSDPSISQMYCCEKCGAKHNGEAWAEGGKNHYKNCERIDADSSDGGGGGGGGMSGMGGMGGMGGFGGMNPMMAMMMSGMGGMGPYGMGGGMGGGCGMGGGGMDSFGPTGNGCKGGGKGKGGGNGMNKVVHPAGQKVWIGSLPPGTTQEDLKTHFEAIGEVKHAGLMKNNTACVCYGTEDEAQQAIGFLNGSEFGGAAIQVDSWTGPS